MLNNQPILNIGMLGSVSDGKSTTVYKLTGTKTQRHSSEMKRNITIKPGYANMKIYKNNDKLISTNSSKKHEGELVHHLSFIDCPGHYELIMTMLSNIELMQGAIVIVSAAEPINKKPQLLQHLLAIKIANFKNVIICLNKLDLISKELALERKRELDELLEKLDIKPKNIIPVCMNRGIGINFLLENIIKFFPSEIKKSENNKNVQFRISRSFDINKNNTNFNDLNGGVLGGSLVNGNLKIGDMIEIRPGIITKKNNNEFLVSPLITKILSLKSDTEKLEEIYPGGLIGIGTDIDPFYCKNDNLVGNIVGLKGKLPHVYIEISMSYNKIKFDNLVDWVPSINDNLNLQIGTNSINGTVKKINAKELSLILSQPVCIDENMMIILSKIINRSLTIVANGYLSNNNNILL